LTVKVGRERKCMYYLEARPALTDARL